MTELLQELRTVGERRGFSPWLRFIFRTTVLGTVVQITLLGSVAAAPARNSPCAGGTCPTGSGAVSPQNNQDQQQDPVSLQSQNTGFGGSGCSTCGKGGGGGAASGAGGKGGGGLGKGGGLAGILGGGKGKAIIAAGAGLLAASGSKQQTSPTPAPTVALFPSSPTGTFGLISSPSSASSSSASASSAEAPSSTASVKPTAVPTAASTPEAGDNAAKSDASKINKGITSF
jgi:hypothetical protein